MAKEAELKKIELKVSVNCCDGCKRKVKKVLQSVEGVLKTEIDPLHPKVTVLGNVDPQILIKRLLKTGKQAELWSSGNQNAGKEKKEADIPVAKEKGKSKSECEKAKSSDSCVKVPDKSREIKNDGDGGENKASKDYKETDASVKSSDPEVVKSENPVPPHPEISNFRTYNQYCYKVMVRNTSCTRGQCFNHRTRRQQLELGITSAMKIPWDAM
ncbi:heavy metal-associated isoprenylated plant protein [Salix suchowensis]|nr:heavy metal-associated isoprenylated plant protein [Salix suchowensis]